MKWKLFKIVPVIFCILFFTQLLYGVDTCSICLEPLVAHEEYGEVVCLSCDTQHHRFHRNCIERSLEADVYRKCPLCRASNPAIMTLPPEPTNFAHRVFHQVKNYVTNSIATVKNRLNGIGHDIEHYVASHPHMSGLWQARNAALAGSASALVGVPYVRGVAASGIVGAFRPHTTFETAWHYPGAFTIGYGLATIYAAIVKSYLCRWIDIPHNAPIISYAPLLPILGVSAFNIWRHS